MFIAGVNEDIVESFLLKINSKKKKNASVE